MNKFHLLLLGPLLLLTSCITPPGGGGSGLHTLRFNNDGSLANRDTLEELRRDIATTPQTVVLFMHGWGGSASSADPNVRGFMRDIELVAKRSYPGRKLTGVYLTWNARHLPGPLELGAYWKTRDRADQIARGDDIANSLKVLSEAVRQHAGSREKFIVAGHSFGGRIIGRVINQHPELLRGIDLVLLINAADDSNSGRQTISAVTAYPAPASRMPHLVWVTSAKDHVIRDIFPRAERHKVAIGFDRELQTHHLNHVADTQPPQVIFDQIRPSSGYRNVIVDSGLHGHSDLWRGSMLDILNYSLWEHPYSR